MTHQVFDAGTSFDLYQSHKSLGFAALALTVLRLLARLLQPAPVRAPGLDGRLARTVQASFYLLTLAAVAAGWLLVSSSPLPVPTRVFGLFVVPDVAAPDATLFGWSVFAHRVAAGAIAALFALHVAGALKHQWIDRDDTVRRMLPPLRRGP